MGPSVPSVPSVPGVPRPPRDWEPEGGPIYGAEEEEEEEGYGHVGADPDYVVEIEGQELRFADWYDIVMLTDAEDISRFTNLSHIEIINALIDEDLWTDEDWEDFRDAHRDS
jgi:hypothetical protein